MKWDPKNQPGVQGIFDSGLPGTPGWSTKIRPPGDQKVLVLGFIYEGSRVGSNF